jgi:hypothetical protein
LAGAPDRWADRAFLHLVKHAQRMLVRNLTEQAWQRQQLRTMRSAQARKRLQAALTENARRAKQIRKTLNRLPGEFEQRVRSRHEATQKRLKAQLKKVDDRLATNPDRQRLRARRTRLAGELDRAARAARSFSAPRLDQSRYLRRARERSQAELARLHAELAEVTTRLATARAAHDDARVSALKEGRAQLYAQLNQAKWQARKLRNIPGAKASA